MSNIDRPGRRRILLLTATATLVAATTFHGTSGAVSNSTGATAATAVVTVDSYYGLLQYDDSPHCSSDAEVAYVANRVIVQTATPQAVADRIDKLIGAPAKSGAKARTFAAPAGGTPAPAATDGTRIADHIDFPVPEDGHGPITPVYAFDLPGDQLHDVVGLARILDGQDGLSAAPDYAAILQGGHDFFQPDGLPEPTTDVPVPRPPARPFDRELGAGVHVSVYDSGLTPVDPKYANLVGNVTPLRPLDVEVPDRVVPGTADTNWAGHGRGVASMIATIAPGATVTNARVAREGISTDFTSAKRIASTLANSPVDQWPNLLVASFMSMACDLDPNLPGDELLPVSLRAASEVVDRLSGQRPGEMVIVAAAGNHGTERRAYPAAFDSVIAVGALDTTLDADGDSLTAPSGTGPVAEFSATGDWVDVYAPGVAITTLHVDGIDFTGVDAKGAPVTVTIDGTAKVQGTSFATPYYVGEVAELMSTHRISVTDAIDLLSSAGEKPQPKCGTSTSPGPGLAVALVDRDAPSDAQALETAVDLC